MFHPVKNRSTESSTKNLQGVELGNNVSTGQAQRQTITEKQVLFEFDTRVDVTRPLPTMSAPDDDDAELVDSDGQLQLQSSGWPNSEGVDVEQTRETMESSSGESHLVDFSSTSMDGLLPSTQRGTTNYHYGYSSSYFHTVPKSLTCDSSSTTSSWAWSTRRTHDLERWWIIACWSCIALLSLVIAAVLATLLVWFIVIPRRPGMQVLYNSTSVHSLDVVGAGNLHNGSRPDYFNSTSGGGVQSAQLSANFSLEILIRNPNRVATDYSASSFSVAYRDTVMGKASIPAFSQRAHGSTRQNVTLLIEDVLVLQPNAPPLIADAKYHDSVSLQVEGHVYARLQILGLAAPPVLIRLLCSIEFKVSELKVSNQQCHIRKRKLYGN